MIIISASADLTSFVGKSLSLSDTRLPMKCSSNIVAWIAHEQRRTSINQSRHKMPIVDVSVVVKVPPNLAAALHASPVDELQSHLLGQHVADGVEVTRVEAVDVFGQQRAFRRGQGGEWQVLGL
jgi:hypothetical protein